MIVQDLYIRREWKISEFLWFFKIQNRLSIQKPVSRKKLLYPMSDLFLNVLLYIIEAKKGC